MSHGGGKPFHLHGDKGDKFYHWANLYALSDPPSNSVLNDEARKKLAFGGRPGFQTILSKEHFVDPRN